MYVHTRADTPRSPNANFLQVGDGRPSLQALSHHRPTGCLTGIVSRSVSLESCTRLGIVQPAVLRLCRKSIVLGCPPLVELGGAQWCRRQVPKTGLLPRIRLACAPPTTLCLLSPPIISHNTTTSTTIANHYYHHRSPSPVSLSRSVIVSLGCRLTCLHNK